MSLKAAYEKNQKARWAPKKNPTIDDAAPMKKPFRYEPTIIDLPPMNSAAVVIAPGPTKPRYEQAWHDFVQLARDRLPWYPRSPRWKDWTLEEDAALVALALEFAAARISAADMAVLDIAIPPGTVDKRWHAITSWVDAVQIFGVPYLVAELNKAAEYEARHAVALAANGEQPFPPDYALDAIGHGYDWWTPGNEHRDGRAGTKSRAA